MDIKKSEATLTVSTRLRATLDNITEQVGSTPERLYADLETQGVKPEGPMIFAYHGIDGQPQTEFDVDIAIPVTAEAAESYQGQYAVKPLESVSCVERVYKGPVSRMGEEGYEPMYADLGKGGMVPSGEVREIYLDWNGPASEDNQTAIQIGIAR